jgi:hypothetical protein
MDSRIEKWMSRWMLGLFGVSLPQGSNDAQCS